MPVLHEYAGKRGLYIKARHGNSLVTYQLTGAAAAELKRRGMREGSQLSHDELFRLVSTGSAYTHGSGAGEVDDAARSNQKSPSYAPKGSPQTTPPAPTPHRPSHSKASSETGVHFGWESPHPTPSFRVCGKCLQWDAIGERDGKQWCWSCERWVGDDACPVENEERAAPGQQPAPAMNATSEVAMKAATSTHPVPQPATKQRAFNGRERTGIAARFLWRLISFKCLGMSIWLWLFVLVGLLLPTILVVDALKSKP
jgi:hypothetical protein